VLHVEKSLKKIASLKSVVVVKDTKGIHVKGNVTPIGVNLNRVG